MGEPVEVRCPVGPQRLFTRLQVGDETARMIQPQNWIEFTCSDCARRIGRQRDQKVRVLHRYNFAGDLIESEIQPAS